MCFHHRVVYGCNHYEWSHVIKACEIETRFAKGETDEGCCVMWSHGRCTTHVEEKCARCAEQQSSTDRTLNEVKDRIKKVKESIDGRLKKSMPPPPAADEGDDSKPSTESTAGSDDGKGIPALENWDEFEAELIWLGSLRKADKPLPDGPGDDTGDVLKPSLDEEKEGDEEEEEKEEEEEDAVEVRMRDPKLRALCLPYLLDRGLSTVSRDSSHDCAATLEAVREFPRPGYVGFEELIDRVTCEQCRESCMSELQS